MRSVEGRSGRPCPRSLADFSDLFWDCDAGDLDVSRDADFIIGRLMEKGGLPEFRWLRATYGDDALRDALLRGRGRALGRRRLRFWQTILEVPEAVVDGWLADPARAVWDGRTA